MLVGPGRDGEIRIRGEAAAPGAQQILGAVEAQLNLWTDRPQVRYLNSGAEVGELSQVLPDMGFQNRLHGVRADAEIGGHHRRDPRRPAGPGVPLLARQAEHQRDGSGPVDHLALQLLQPDAAFLRLQHLVGGARLQIRHAAGHRRRRQSLLAQRLADRADGGFRHRAQRRRVPAALHRRIGRLRPARVRRRGIDRAVGVQHQPARRRAPSAPRRARCRRAPRTRARSFRRGPGTRGLRRSVIAPRGDHHTNRSPSTKPCNNNGLELMYRPAYAFMCSSQPPRILMRRNRPRPALPAGRGW